MPSAITGRGSPRTRSRECRGSSSPQRIFHSENGDREHRNCRYMRTLAVNRHHLQPPSGQRVAEVRANFGKHQGRWREQGKRKSGGKRRGARRGGFAGQQVKRGRSQTVRQTRNAVVCVCRRHLQRRRNPCHGQVKQWDIGILIRHAAMPDRPPEKTVPVSWMERKLGVYSTQNSRQAIHMFSASRKRKARPSSRTDFHRSAIGLDDTVSAAYFLGFSLRLMTASLRESKELSVLEPLAAP